MHLLDEYIIGRMVVTSTVLELIAFVWIYGLESLSNDFEFVLGYKLCFVWKFVWLGTPILFMVRTAEFAVGLSYIEYNMLLP